MAENKNAKKAAAAAAAAEESTPAEHIRHEKKKSRWTLETCQRAAKRFSSRDDWSAGAPSSFKAAVAKGWDNQCCAHMSKVATKAVKNPTKSVSKKSAPRLPKSA